MIICTSFKFRAYQSDAQILRLFQWDATRRIKKRLRTARCRSKTATQVVV